MATSLSTPDAGRWTDVFGQDAVMKLVQAVEKQQDCRRDLSLIEVGPRERVERQA